MKNILNRALAAIAGATAVILPAVHGGWFWVIGTPYLVMILAGVAYSFTDECKDALKNSSISSFSRLMIFTFLFCAPVSFFMVKYQSTFLGLSLFIMLFAQARFVYLLSSEGDTNEEDI